MNFKTVAFSFLVLGLAVGVGFFYNNDKAAEAQGSNIAVTDHAWSSNIGWVKFDGLNYGVEIESDGDFTGYAWSSNVGWLNFDAGNGPTNGPAGSAHSVKVDSMTNPTSLSGWARFESQGGGWDGWVNFDDVDYNQTTGKFEGYAWGDDVVGWMDMKLVTANIPIVEPCDPLTDVACCEEAPAGCTCDNLVWRAANQNQCNPDPTNELEVKIIGEGKVDVPGKGVCSSNQNGNTCNYTFADQTSLVLTAQDVLNSEFSFKEWVYGCSGSNISCNINVTGSKSVTAQFEKPSCDPNCVEPDAFTFVIDGTDRFRVINPPNTSHNSSKIKITATVGSDFANSVSVDEGLNSLIGIAGANGATAPTLEGWPTIFEPGVPTTFDLFITFPDKARNSDTGVNMYNTDRRAINIIVSAPGATPQTISTFLQYFDPTIIQQ